MIIFSEVQQKDAERAYEEFFRDEFRSQRLGTFGYWFGTAHFTLGLRDPASQTTLSNLVRGLTPNGNKKILEGAENPERMALWRLDFVAPQSLSVLWAMSPGTYRSHLESIPLMAATEVFVGIHRQLLFTQKPRSLGDYAATLSLTFCHGASHDQSPNLQVTAFVLTHGFLRDGSARELAGDVFPLQKETMHRIYDRALRLHLKELIGPIQQVPGIRDLRFAGVPQELVRRFFFDSSFNRDSGFEKNTKPLEDLELFAKWRKQGEGFGWDVEQAKALLREAKRQKYWDDLKSDFRAKIQETAQRVHDWKESWKPKAKPLAPPLQEKASRPKEEGHKHSH